MKKTLLRGLLIGLGLSFLNLVWSLWRVRDLGVQEQKWIEFNSFLLSIIIISISLGMAFTVARLEMRNKQTYTEENLLIEKVGLVVVALLSILCLIAMRFLNS